MRATLPIFGSKTRKISFFFVAVFLSTLVTPAPAATITRGGSNKNLNRKQAWDGGRVPGAGDIAAWDSGSNGTSTLGGNLSWLGIQILSGTGAITINGNNTLTLGTSGIDMSAATANFTINCAVVLAAAQTWSVNSGRTLAVTGVVSGSGGITKTGTGILTLSGTNTYTGDTTIDGGTLSHSTASALGIGTGALTINATGILQATGTFLSSRAVVLGGIGGAGSGGTFDVTGTNNLTRTGVISGSGSLTKTGTGILTLTAANTYTGETYLNGGTLSIGNAEALGALPPSLGSTLYRVHLAGGTTLQTTVSTTGANRQVELVSGTATLDVTSGVSHQQDGLVYGAGGLTKTGTGTAILTNANTYSGTTTINGGTLQVNNASGSGTGTGAVVVNSGGTLSGLPTAIGFAAPGSISGNVTVNSGGSLLARSGSTFTFGGLTLNAGAITNFQIGAATAGAIINITGINGLSLAGASTINITNAGGLAAGTYHLFDYNGTPFANLANLSLGSTPGGGFTYSLVNNSANTSVDLLVLASTAQWGNAAGGNWSLAGNWADNGTPNLAGAQANFLGAISSAQTVTVNSAFTVGTITFNNLNSYSVVGSSLLTLNNNGIALIDVAAGSHSITAPIALANNLQITAAAGTALNLVGVLSESGGSKTLGTNGAGTVTFSGAAANTYTGLTTVNAGTLNLNKTAGSNAIGSGGVSVSSGATLGLLASNQIADAASVRVDGTFALSTFSEVIGALNGAGSVTTGAGSLLTIGASNNLSSQFNGVISGAGSIAKAGTGTLTLTGNNTFGGVGKTVAINAGTLQIANDASLGNAANSVTLSSGTLALMSNFSTSRSFTLSGAGTIDTGPDTATLNGVISGTGPLVKTGGGTLALTNTNLYTGGTTINGGTVLVNSASSLGAAGGSLTINGGTLQVATGYTSTRAIALGSATSSITVNSGQTLTSNGIVSGTGTLNKDGTGTLILGSGANTYTGGTVINGGTLTVLGANNGLQDSSAVVVNSGGTLLLGASNQISNTKAIELVGGTIAKGNFSEGSASTAGFGALTLSDDSFINFGTGTVGILTFASLDLTADLNTLTILNWTGTANTVGTAATDRLIFNSSQNATNLANINFAGYANGAAQFSLGSGYYEVVPFSVSPVPEPSTYAAGLLALGALIWTQRGRLRALRRRV